MLITQLKDKEAIESVLRGKVFLINCHGCKEVRFPVAEAEALRKELSEAGRLAGVITTDYICNVENLTKRLEKHAAEIAEAETILVLSCGVGVQTVADMFADKRVCAGCDTLPMPGFQQMQEKFFPDAETQVIPVRIKFGKNAEKHSV